jgi:hypothetical protein
MTCIDVQTEKLTSSGKGTGIYSIKNRFDTIVSVKSKCGEHLNYEILNDRSIRFECDLPCECTNLCMLYTPKKVVCGNETDCNC